MMRRNASSAGHHPTAAAAHIALRISIDTAQVATNAAGAAQLLPVAVARIVQQKITKSNSEQAAKMISFSSDTRGDAYSS